MHFAVPKQNGHFGNGDAGIPIVDRNTMISALERDTIIKTTRSTQIVEILTNVGFILKFRLRDQSDFVDLDQIFEQILTTPKLDLVDGKKSLNRLVHQLLNLESSVSEIAHCMLWRCETASQNFHILSIFSSGKCPCSRFKLRDGSREKKFESTWV